MMGAGAEHNPQEVANSPGAPFGLGRFFVIAALLLAVPVRAVGEPVDPVAAEPSFCASAISETTAQLPGSGLVIAIPASDCDETPQPPPRPAGPDVFGSAALAVASTPLDARWRAARDAGPPGDGPWTPMLREAAAQERAAQLRLVNGWVNARLGFTEDIDRDDWASLARSFARGRGDCEDFAIAKLQLLESLGLPSDDMYLVIVRDEPRGADHAVLAVREGAGLVVLDSKADRILRSEEVAGYRPILSYSTEFAWTHGYAQHLSAPGGDRASPPAERSKEGAQ